MRRTLELHGGLLFPTNYAAVTAAPPATTTFDPAQLDAGAALSNGNLTVTAGGGKGSVLSVAGHTTGKYYLEYAPVGNSGYTNGFGIINTHAPQYNTSGAGIGNDGFSGGWWTNDGNLYVINNTVPGTVGLTATNGDVIGMAVDLGNTNIWYRKNGGNWNNSGTANPATNTGGITIAAVVNGPTIYVYAAVVSGASHTANFGATAYGTAAPSGFGNW